MPGTEHDDEPVRRPVYPEITQAQWAWLVAKTDQRLVHDLEAGDFIAELPDHIKSWLKSEPDPDVLKWLSKADKAKLDKFDAAMTFMDNMAFMSKWLLKGLGVLAFTITFIIGTYHGLKGSK